MYYFAYALDLSKKQMQAQCPGSKTLFTATLPNYKLVFAGWSRQWHGGMATVMSFRGDKVRGALYDVTEAGMRQLEKHNTGYSRLNITVFDEDNEPHQAVALVRTGQLDEAMPSREYGEIIKQGYLDWGLI
jgi:gamma-glutamylcyclotransferase